jgi:hypothetical protein
MAELKTTEEILAAAGVSLRFANALLTNLRCEKCGSELLVVCKQPHVPERLACMNPQCSMYGIQFKVPKYPLEAV